MKKLLAVSAQEDDLNRSLQNLDALLIQARNVLQASYTEVQRLLPLRQQVTVTEGGLHFFLVPPKFLWRTGMLTITFNFSCVSALTRSAVRELAALKFCAGCKVQLFELCRHFLSARSSHFTLLFTCRRNLHGRGGTNWGRRYCCAASPASHRRPSQHLQPASASSSSCDSRQSTLVPVHAGGQTGSP